MYDATETIDLDDCPHVSSIERQAAFEAAAERIQREVDDELAGEAQQRRQERIAKRLEKEAQRQDIAPLQIEKVTLSAVLAQIETLASADVARRLSDRQRAVCILRLAGESNKGIARQLDCGERTVENVWTATAKAAGVPTTQLIVWVAINRAALASEGRAA